MHYIHYIVWVPYWTNIFKVSSYKGFVKLLVQYLSRLIKVEVKYCSVKITKHAFSLIYLISTLRWFLPTKSFFFVCPVASVQPLNSQKRRCLWHYASAQWDDLRMKFFTIPVK